MSRYLLCRPRGGLNDTLCQIEKCWQYCDKYNRILIIDTTRSGIFIKFSDIFKDITNSNYLFELSNEKIIEINNLTCQIKQIEGKLDSYKSIYINKENYNLVDINQKISFDFDKDYQEDVLIYEQCGGGTDSFKLLKKLTFVDDLKLKIKNLKLKTNYKSIHVRNTDYKTDYTTLFKNIKSELKGDDVLICSDDGNVINKAIDILSESNVFTKTNNKFSLDGNPLHNTFNNYTDEEKRILTENSIIDLVLLGLSDKIYYSNISNFDFTVISGFTKLSLLLNEEKSVINQLID